MEELIIHTIKISRAAQLQHFEIPLSKNAQMICGLWYKIRLLDDAGENGVVISLKEASRSVYIAEVIVGKLSLCSNQREGVFFYGDLILENANEGMLDYTAPAFAPKPYTHTNFTKQLQVRVDANTVTVHGFIQDNWGVISARDVNYEVDIYLYQKLNQTSSKNGTRSCTELH